MYGFFGCAPFGPKVYSGFDQFGNPCFNPPPVAIMFPPPSFIFNPPPWAPGFPEQHKPSSSVIIEELFSDDEDEKKNFCEEEITNEKNDNQRKQQHYICYQECCSDDDHKAAPAPEEKNELMPHINKVQQQPKARSKRQPHSLAFRTSAVSYGNYNSSRSTKRTGNDDKGRKLKSDSDTNQTLHNLNNKNKGSGSSSSSANRPVVKGPRGNHWIGD